MTTTTPETAAGAAIPPWQPVRPLWLRALGAALNTGRMKLGLVITAVILVIAAVGPFVAPHNPSEFVGLPASGSSSAALLGTDYLGRDVLSRVLHGGWTVVWMSLAATVLGVGLGVMVGLIVGYRRGWLDDTVMGICDVILAFPQIVLALLFVALLGPKLWLIVLLVAAGHFPRVVRLVRSMTLELRERPFVESAELLGLSRQRLLRREVLPNLLTPVMVEFGVRLTWSIGIIAAISFLGFGIQSPAADWGLMINENRSLLVIQPWGVVVPVLCIALFTIGVNLMAEGVARAVGGVEELGGKREHR